MALACSRLTFHRLHCYRCLKTSSLLQVLAAISDDTIAVWDAHSGDLEQRLRGHTFRTHVLECHPLDPRLVMSAGYDGQTIVWDLAEGRALARCAPLLCLCPLHDSLFVFPGCWESRDCQETNV